MTELLLAINKGPDSAVGIRRATPEMMTRNRAPPQEPAEATKQPLCRDAGSGGTRPALSFFTWGCANPTESKGGFGKRDPLPGTQRRYRRRTEMGNKYKTDSLPVPARQTKANLGTHERRRSPQAPRDHQCWGERPHTQPWWGHSAGRAAQPWEAAAWSYLCSAWRRAAPNCGDPSAAFSPAVPRR